MSSPAPSPAARVLILGLGNDILTDDAVGLLAVRQLREMFAVRPEFSVQETMEMGLALLDYMVGYEVVIIVDSIQTGAAAGTIHEVNPAELKTLTGRTPHFLGVGETLALGHKLGLAMPHTVRIVAIEVEDPFTLGTALTPTLARVLPEAVKRVRSLAESLGARLKRRSGQGDGVGESVPTR